MALVQGIPAWLYYVGWNTSTNAYQTGDVANHTLRFLSDSLETTPANAAFEVDATNRPGLYAVAPTSAETQFNLINLGGKSSTTSVVLIDRSYVFAATSLAQIGVNVIRIHDAVATSSLAAGGVNVVNIQGQTAQLDGNNLLKVDLEDIAGAAVNVNAAQLGVNAVNIGGALAATSLATGGVNVNQIRGLGTVTSLAAGNVNVAQILGGAVVTSALAGNVNVVSVQGLGAVSSLALGNVNVVQIAQAAVTLDANNLLKVDVEDIAGAVVNVNAAQLGVNAVNIAGVAAATSLASGNVTVAKFTPGIITTAAFTAGALATTVFPTNFLTAALVDATANNAIADALLDRTNGVETGVTPRQSWRGVGASAFGALSGAGTAQVQIWGGGSSVTRVVAATDASGNRASVTVNL